MEKKDMFIKPTFDGQEIIYERTLPGGGKEYLLKKVLPESSDDMPEVCRQCLGPWPICQNGCKLFS